MDFGSINPVLLIASLMVASTPILLAAMGELVVERSGVLNLGVEGMMIVGAISGFIVAVEVGSPALGFVAAAAAAAILALLFGFLTQVLLSNQVATGLGLTLFGLGVSSLMGQGYTGIRPPSSPRMPASGPAGRFPGRRCSWFRSPTCSPAGFGAARCAGGSGWWPPARAR